MRSRKHHYIPKCYLKQWAGDDKRLIAYQRPFDHVVERRMHPSATGWVDNLYGIANVSEDERDVVERTFFARVDQEADEVLQIFLSGGVIKTAKHQNAWSRFLMSLLQRHPARIAEIREEAKAAYEKEMADKGALYEQYRKPDDPESYEEYLARTSPETSEKFVAMIIQRFSDLPNLGEHLNRMVRRVVHIQNPERPLLTSDRPLIATDGLGRSDASLLLPISPNHVFVATNTEAEGNRILAKIESGEMIKKLNADVVARAWKWVYAFDDSQRRFVINRFPRRESRW